MGQVTEANSRDTEPPTTLNHKSLLDDVPAALYMTDAEGRVVFFNRAAEELAGRVPIVGQDKWCVSWRLYTADGRPLPLDECPMAQTIKSGQAVRNVEVIAERPDGVRVPLLPFPTPLYDPDSRLIGAVNMLVDLTQVKNAQNEIARRAEEQGALYRFTDRLYRAESEHDVYDAALDAIVAALRCRRASILLFDDSGVMQFVASRGLSHEYRRAVAGHSPWNRGEPRPVPIHVDDADAVDFPQDLKQAIRSEGIGAMAFIPIVADGGVVGKFMAYHDAPHTFSSNELELGLVIARQLGFAVERRHAELRLRQSEERFRTIVDTTPEWVKLVARDGRLLHMNASGLATLGIHSIENIEGQSIFEVIAPEDRDRFRVFNESICAGQRGSLEFDIVGLNGVRRHMETHAAPFANTDGSIVQLAVTRDVSERKQAEARERNSASEFRALADNIHQFAWMTDATGWIYWYNQRWFDYTGTSLEEMRGWGWTKVHHPDHVDRVVASFKKAVSSGQPWEDTFPLRSKDGDYRWFLSRALPIRADNGHVVRWFGTNTDITDRLQAEEQRTLLINELNHRVKNTLATVQSLAMQTLRKEERREEALMLFNSRVAALSRAHDILTNEHWKGAQLQQVVDQSLAPFRTTDRIVASGPNILVTPKQALALSMALHELGTNAIKYGALSDKAGRISLTWSVANGFLEMSWREHGGPPVVAPTRTGFGTRLIERSFSNDLNGEAKLVYLREGILAQMRALMET